MVWKIKAFARLVQMAEEGVKNKKLPLTLKSILRGLIQYHPNFKLKILSLLDFQIGDVFQLYLVPR